MNLSVEEKLNIIETEYHIPIEDSVRKDVSDMCNLSQGILEKGEVRGEAKIILNMYKKGFTMEQIASATDKKTEEIKDIIEKWEPVMA
jgi:SOS response regulatory protein OraA/RecX